MFKYVFYVNLRILIQRYAPVNNKFLLLRVMVSCQTDDNPMFEPMTALFIDAYMYQLALTS